MLAVALNGDNRLVIIGRDVASGNMAAILGSLAINVGGDRPGMVTCAVWDEDYGGYTWRWNLSTGSHAMVQPSRTGAMSSIASFSSASTVPPLLIALSSVLASGTSRTSVSATGTAVSTPTPFQTGMVAGCTQFHLVVANDTCSSIASAAGISLSDFYTWNPAVGSSCASLDVADNVCVGSGHKIRSG